MSQEHAGEAFVAKAAVENSARPEDEDERLIAVWALGETRAMSDRERRLTAAAYARLPGLVAQVREAGRLPQRIAGTGMAAELQWVVQRRGVDPELTEPEKVVLGALGPDAPGGRAVLIDARSARERQVAGRS